MAGGCALSTSDEWEVGLRNICRSIRLQLPFDTMHCTCRTDQVSDRGLVIDMLMSHARQTGFCICICLHSPRLPSRPSAKAIARRTCSAQIRPKCFSFAVPYSSCFACKKGPANTCFFCMRGSSPAALLQKEHGRYLQPSHCSKLLSVSHTGTCSSCKPVPDIQGWSVTSHLSSCTLSTLCAFYPT